MLNDIKAKRGKRLDPGNSESWIKFVLEFGNGVLDFSTRWMNNFLCLYETICMRFSVSCKEAQLFGQWGYLHRVRGKDFSLMWPERKQAQDQQAWWESGRKSPSWSSSRNQDPWELGKRMPPFVSASTVASVYKVGEDTGCEWLQFLEESQNLVDSPRSLRFLV